MAINVFGVTAASAAAKVGFLTLSASTEPTTSEVDDWIQEHASELNLILEDKGRDVDLILDAGDTQKLYRHCRGMLKTVLAADIHATNQNGNTELAERYLAAWNGFVGSLKKNPSLYLGGSADKHRSNRTTGTDTAAVLYWKKGMDL